MTSACGRTERGSQKKMKGDIWNSTLLIITKGGQGGGEVKKKENFVDVIYGWSFCAISGCCSVPWWSWSWNTSAPVPGALWYPHHSFMAFWYRTHGLGSPPFFTNAKRMPIRAWNPCYYWPPLGQYEEDPTKKFTHALAL